MREEPTAPRGGKSAPTPGRLSWLKRARPYVAAISTGTLAGWALRPDGIGLASLIAWVPLLLALRESGPVKAALLGWLTGVSSVLMGASWMLETLAHATGEVSSPLSAVWLLGVGFWGLGVAAWACSASIAMGTAGPWRWIFPCLSLGALELWFPFLFPIHYGLANWDTPVLLQVAEVGGGPAVTALMLLGNLVWVESIRSRKSASHPIGIYCTFVALVLVSAVRMKSFQVEGTAERVVKIAAIQPEFGLLDRNDSTLRAGQRARSLQGTTAAVSQQSADLILWHEGAWPFPLSAERESDFPIGHPWRVLPSDGNAALIAGMLTRDERGRQFNSATAYEPNGAISGRYDKRELFTLGETDQLDGLLERIGLDRTDLSADLPLIEAGAGPRLLPVAGLQVAPLICNEELSTTDMTTSEWREADLLVGLSSEDWFGAGTAGTQHLAFATLRSIECRRSYVRAASMSGTGWVDPSGRVRQHLSGDGARGAATRRPRYLLATVPIVKPASLGPWALPVFPRALAACLIFMALSFLINRGREVREVRYTTRIRHTSLISRARRKSALAGVMLGGHVAGGAGCADRIIEGGVREGWERRRLWMGRGGVGGC